MNAIKVENPIRVWPYLGLMGFKESSCDRDSAAVTSVHNASNQSRTRNPETSWNPLGGRFSYTQRVTLQWNYQHFGVLPCVGMLIYIFGACLFWAQCPWKSNIPPVDSSGKLWPCWRGLKVEGSTKWHKFIIFPLISTRMGQIMSTNTPLRRDCFYINCQRWNLEFQGITMYYTRCHPCPQKTTTAWHPIAPLWHGSHGSICRTCREDPAWLRKLAQILPCNLRETLRDCGQPWLLVGGLAVGARLGALGVGGEQGLLRNS